MKFEKIAYDSLNARQKENYNFQKISSVLADYGYTTMRLSDDWQGADFIAQDKNGAFIKVQLKGRLTFAEKYCGKEIFVCFRDTEDWYLFDHDVLLSVAIEKTNIKNTESWKVGHEYSFPTIPKELGYEISQYKIG